MKNYFLILCSNLKDRIQDDGLFLTITYYIDRLLDLGFAIACFNRTDVFVKRDLRIIGKKNMSIGKNFIMRRGGWLECVLRRGKDENAQSFNPKLIIGNNVGIGEYAHIACNNFISIGNDVMMGSKIYITDHNHGYYSGREQSNPDSTPGDRILTYDGSVEIGNNVWIGELCVILPNVKIGNGSIIGSNSVVTHSIPEYSIAVGSPAKVIKKWDVRKNKWVKV